jgi:hypothetical protein
MRSTFLALLAALALAAPAAAQPDPAQILLGALERARENVPAGTENYLMTLTFGPARPQLYAYREADGWKTEEEDDAPLGDMFHGMVIWPRLAASVPPGATAADVAAAYPGLRYVGTDTVEGRTAHVLMMEVPGLTLENRPMPGPARVSIDAETRQVLRIAASQDLGPDEYDPLLADGGHEEMAMTFGGYESVNGVTLPRRWGMHVRMRMNLSAEQLAPHRDEMTQLLGEIDQMGSDPPIEIQQTRMLIEMGLAMLNGEPLDVAGVLEDVQMNAGPPAWFSGNDQ